MRLRSATAVAAALSLLLLIVPTAARDALAGDALPPDGPCGLPPEAKPQRIKGGESFPPLPLPATPLRRTERKREPAPPTLVGKVVWGASHTETTDDGRTWTWADWNLDPSDVKGLLKSANRRLGVRYGESPVDLATFSFDPEEIPVLYIGGKRGPTFDEATRTKLRGYLENGGTLWADACAGSAAFTAGVRADLAQILPGRPVVRIPLDHPLFRCVNVIDKVRYSPAAATERADGAPYVEGVEIGCRMAVVLSPYGMSCAWDSFHVHEGAKLITGDSAFQLGTNMTAYALAYFDLGRFLAKRRAVAAADDALHGDFVFAQVRHGERWDPAPSGFTRLLKTTLAVTNTQVAFGRKDVTLDDPRLQDHPFLYLTGHGPLDLTEAESAGLARYLRGGGFVFADACCGNLEFDRSFRAELKRALPAADLKELPRDHPVFSSFYPLETVEYTPQVRADLAGMNAPYLEAVTVDGEVRVVYSRFGIGSAWDGVERPWARGVLPKDALRLGVNVIVYVLTH